MYCFCCINFCITIAHNRTELNLERALNGELPLSDAEAVVANMRKRRGESSTKVNGDAEAHSGNNNEV